MQQKSTVSDTLLLDYFPPTDPFGTLRDKKIKQIQYLSAHHRQIL